MVALPSLRLSLHEWASLKTELLGVYDQVVEPEYRHFRTSVGRAGYWARYVRAGCIRISGPSGTIEAQPGQWLIGEHEKGVIDITDDTHILSVHFLCQWPTGDNFFGKAGVQLFSNDFRPALLRQAKMLERAVHRHYPYTRVGYAHEQAAYPDFLRQQALFVNWLATWCETLGWRGWCPAYGGSDDERLTRVVRRLNESPLAAGFPKALLRTETKLSIGQLDLKFGQAFGLSPWRYWERRRLEHAKRQLTQIDAAPIKQIAYELGFKSDAHFVAWFRRLTGGTPGRFRAEQQG